MARFYQMEHTGPGGMNPTRTFKLLCTAVFKLNIIKLIQIIKLVKIILSWITVVGTPLDSSIQQRYQHVQLLSLLS